MAGFVKAVKKGLKLRIALDGVTGGGKTYTALLWACAIAAKEGKRVAFIDTERSSGLIYADQFDFDHMNLTNFSPDEYIKAMKLVDPKVYAVTVIDSGSHAWMGTGGVLDIKDKATQADRNKDSFAAWRTATPKQNAFIDAILSMPTHVIMTMRSKMEYVKQTDESGRSKIVRLGLAPVQREGVEYEFDFIADLENKPPQFIVSKSRYGFDGYVSERGTEEMAIALWNEANKGDGNLQRVAHTREDLLGEAAKLGLSGLDVRDALQWAEEKFDPERWDEMLRIIKEYSELPVEAPAQESEASAE